MIAALTEGFPSVVLALNVLYPVLLLFFVIALRDRLSVPVLIAYLALLLPWERFMGSIEPRVLVTVSLLVAGAFLSFWREWRLAMLICVSGLAGLTCSSKLFLELQKPAASLGKAKAECEASGGVAVKGAENGEIFCLVRR